MSQISLKSGDTIKNRYVLKSRLGGGIQGVVYSIQDLNSPQSQKVAKIALKDQMGRHECELLRKMSKTPHSVVFYEDFPLDSKYWVIVTDTAGESIDNLRSKKRDRRFVDSNVIKMTHDLLNALEKIHGYGFLHRDVHAGNVCAKFLNQNARLSLIDFGLALKISCYSRTRSHSHSIRNFRDGLQSSVALMTGGRFEPLDDVYALGYMSLTLVGQQRIVFDRSVKTMLRKKAALDYNPSRVLRPTRFMVGYFKELSEQKAADSGVDFDALRDAILSNSACVNPRRAYKIEKYGNAYNFK